MSENILKTKSYAFSLEVIKLYKQMIDLNKEYTLSRQLLRSGTSIGANICESVRACSKLDFRNKLYISLKEAEETIYWVNLLKDSDFITKEDTDILLKHCNEIISILVCSLQTIDLNQKMQKH